MKSLKLSNGFDFSIEPRQAVIVEHIPGILVHQEEADRIGRKLAPFGARKIKPGFYMIPCNSRGKLPSLRFELAAVNNNDASIVLDFNEYIVNYVSSSNGTKNLTKNVSVFLHKKVLKNHIILFFLAKGCVPPSCHGKLPRTILRRFGTDHFYRKFDASRKGEEKLTSAFIAEIGFQRIPLKPLVLKNNFGP